jgi:hypothetical protein
MSKTNQTPKKRFRAHFSISASKNFQTQDGRLAAKLLSNEVIKKGSGNVLDVSEICNKNLIDPLNTFVNIKKNCSKSSKFKNNSPPKLETFYKLAKLYQIEMPKIKDDVIRISKERFKKTFRLKGLFLKSMKKKKDQVLRNARKSIENVFLKYVFRKYNKMTKMSMIILLTIFNNACKKNFPDLTKARIGKILSHRFLLNLYDKLLSYYKILVQKNVNLTRNTHK